MTSHKRISRPANILGAALLATMIGGGTALAAMGSEIPGTPQASIIAFDQKHGGNSVSIRYAFLPKDGSLAIYSVDKSGKRGTAPLGKVDLKAGDHRDVTVPLSAMAKKGMWFEAVVEQGGKPVTNTGNTPERTFGVLS